MVRWVILVFIKHINCIDSQYRNDADEPPYGKDTKERSLLAFRNMQAPNASNWNNSNHEICDDIYGSVGVPQPAAQLVSQSQL